jgi:hypothetical protein
MRCINNGAPVRDWLSCVAAVLLALPPNALGQDYPAPQQTISMAPLPAVQSLKVIPLAGSGEMNDLQRKIMAPLVVQVLDQNDRPVEGADVIFRFPLEGPGASFAGQKTSRTVRSNGQGQAAATGWTANGELGTFKVHVTASRGNEIGETTISMTNVTRIAGEGKTNQRPRSWHSSKWFKIGVIAVGAGLATGIILATRGGGGGGSTNTTITISPGSPTVGGPH